MARLLTVVNERKKLRSEYRQHLEDEYISQKKQEELDLFIAEREISKMNGVPFVQTPQEMLEGIQKRDKRNQDTIDLIRNKIQKQANRASKASGKSTALDFNKTDMKLLAQ